MPNGVKIWGADAALRKIMGVVMLCFIATDSIGQDWTLKKDVEGIKVYTGKTPNSAFKSIKVECTINAHLSQLVAFLLDVSRQHDWVYSNENSELVKKVAPNEFIFYAEVGVPWPVANRDYISHITIVQQTPQFLTIDAYTEPDLLPEKPGRVRVRHSHAHWDVTTLSKYQQQIVYTVEFDPAGSLPAWLVNMFVTKGPLETFQKLRTCVSDPQYQAASVDFIKESN
jgi:hypothetical protein